MSAAPQLRWVASDGVHLIWVWAACLLSLGGGGFFAFRDELQGAAENSEAGLSALGAIVQELMAQPVATPATGYLYGSRPIVLWPLGHTVSMDGLGERRPWGRVCVLGAAGEELIATLGTHVDTRLKVVLENLAPEEAAERHGAGGTTARRRLRRIRGQTQDPPLVPAQREPVPL